jgi:putative transposase
LKETHPFLKSVHSSPLKNAALQLTRAIQDYQKSRKGKRKGKPTGWPSFRSHKVKPFSLLYDEPGKGFKLEGRTLRLSLGQTSEGKRIYVTGTVEKPLSSFEGAEVKQLRIKREHDRYYAVFSVVRKFRPESRPGGTAKFPTVIALDPNHKNLAYGVDNAGQAIEIANFRGAKYFDREIDRVKSKRDKCLRKSKPVTKDGKIIYFKPSRRYQRLDKAHKRLLQKRRDQTKLMLQTVANYLCKHYSVIAIGDYTPRGGGISKSMRRSMNNQSLIGRFKLVVKWVAARSGRVYIEWPEHGSTRTCSACGYKLANGLSPDIRSWDAPPARRERRHQRFEASDAQRLVLLRPDTARHSKTLSSVYRQRHGANSARWRRSAKRHHHSRRGTETKELRDRRTVICAAWCHCLGSGLRHSRGQGTEPSAGCNCAEIQRRPS